MSKITLVFSLVLLIGGFLYWFDQTREILELLRPAAAQQQRSGLESSPTQRPSDLLPSLQEISRIDSNLGFEADQETQGDQRQIANAKREIISEPSGRSTADPRLSRSQSRKQVYDQIVGFEQRLREAQSELSLQQRRLEILKQQQEKEPASLSGSSTDRRIEENALEIQILTNLLEAYRSAENNISRRANASLEIQNKAIQLQRDRIDRQIQELEQSTLQFQKEIQSWNQKFFDLTVRNDRLAELRSQLTTQTQALESLRNQRVQISAETLSQARAINGIALSEQEAIAQSQRSVQEEILLLQNEIQRLQQAQALNQNQTRNSSDNPNNQISQIQKSIQHQKQKIQEINESIRASRQKMKNI